MTNPDVLVGLTLDDARDWCVLHYMTLRVVKNDGESWCGDAALNLMRVNVEVENGRISKVVGRG